MFTGIGLGLGMVPRQASGAAPPSDPMLRAGTLTNPPFSMTLGWNAPDAMGHNPFINWMKTGTTWGPWGVWDTLLANGNVNLAGDIISIPAGGEVNAYVAYGVPANSGATGHYRLTWTGAGTASVGNVANLTTINANRLEFDFVANGTNFMDVKFTAITGGPITNVKVVHQDDWAADDAGEKFRRSWLDLIRNSRVLRFKDWQFVDNYEGGTTWASRAPANSASYQNVNGVPIETMVELCNLVGADPWFCMPHTVDDDYVTQFATLVRSQLRAQQNVYVEYSHKCWDGNLSQAQYCAQQGGIAFGSASDTEAQSEWYGGRASQVMQRWQAVWTGVDAARLKRVAQIWTDNHYVESLIMDAPRWVALGGGRVAPHTVMSEYAVHALMDGGLRYDWTSGTVATIQGWIDTLTDSQIFDNMALACRNEANKFEEGRTLEGEVAHWAYHKNVADYYSLNMICYEGGTHIVTPGSMNGNARWNQVYNDFHYSPQWGTVWNDMITAWYSAYGPASIFNKYSDVMKPSGNKNEGLYRFIGDTNPQATAWVTQQNARTGATGRGADDFVGSYDLVTP